MVAGVGTAEPNIPTPGLVVTGADEGREVAAVGGKVVTDFGGEYCAVGGDGGDVFTDLCSGEAGRKVPGLRTNPVVDGSGCVGRGGEEGGEVGSDEVRTGVLGCWVRC